jgi:NHL repeat
LLTRPKLALIAAIAGTLWLISSASANTPAPYITNFSTTSILSSTVPKSNGDQNPYGIVTVPATMGRLHSGDILVSNFNNEGPTVNGMPTTGGNQGEGTTIMQFNSDGSDPRLFAKIDRSDFPGGVGLTTALVALPNDYVVVGSLPTSDGTSATMKAGELIILDPSGDVVGHISGGPINGPWDMTSVSDGSLTTLFVSNVLNGTVAHSPNTVHRGTVVRIRLRTVDGQTPTVLGEQVIASGFAERTDPSALVVGPTGVGVGADGTLYVADSVNSRIAEIPHALTRDRVFGDGGITLTHKGDLNDPLGLTIAPNGDILSANGGDGNLVETTPAGTQVAEKLLDSNNVTGAGDLFGIAINPPQNGVLYVDDFDNTLRLLH